ncbi:hypothetical protein GCM10027598_82290 [Amycolatopsis oliviviridis]|uniref:Uncharacterized protein n=1 Tax=Amycolatopsis oliviviridis TaxID=1471590 RepID=A0ABQ3L6G8_9PSEU|nr:hypothetical protein [Amycolatopsis oliviviridis]GHH06594.1 hypothetical protein GCM10017790_12190 [Amycolatopsis oliviviridis]
MPKRWNEIDWDDPRPGPSEVAAAQNGIAWAAVPVTAPALDRYLEHVTAAYANGGYLLGRWRAVDYPDAAAWFVARNRAEEFGLLRVFFDSEVVREGLGELRIPDPLDPDVGGFQQDWTGLLCLDGILAHLIVSGGAYGRYRGPASDAKALAGAAVEALTQNRYEDFRVHASLMPWTPWFEGATWDRTYVLTDTANAEITVLCVTDTN